MKVMNIKENSILFKLISAISRFIYSHCDMIGVQTPAFFEYFQDIHGIASNKLAYIPQFADSSYLNKNFNKPHEGINLIFLGNIGLVQDMECIVEAVSINAKDSLPYKVHIVGEGSFLSNLKQLVKQKRLDEYFVFYGRRPVQEMETFYGFADACLLTLKGDSFVGKTVPGKLQGYMAAGKTVIAAIDGPAQQIIHDADCGLVTNAGNAEDLAEHIKQFVTHIHDYQNCGINGRIYFQKHFMKEQCVKHVLDVLDRLKEDA
jgi:glycosyltransferase involved in cell wall biosynthesis